MRRTAILAVVVFVGVVLAGGVVADETGHETESAVVELECAFPFEVEDGGGHSVTVEEEPDEVVVLAPNTAQHMWEIGAEEKVTGMPVNQFTAYLEGSDERTNVVDDVGMPIQEEVVALEPDLVIAASVIPGDTVESLRDAGLTVYHSPVLTSPDDMLAEVETVGQLVGECEGAEGTVEETRETFEAIENAVAGEDRPTVYYDLGFPWTVGEGTLEHQLITMAGGENIALEADEPGYFEISEEVIAEEDPEWLVVSEDMGIPDVTAIQESTAVEEDQVIEVNSNFISQHGPRNVIPLEQMAEAFHPEAMAALGEADDADDVADDADGVDDADDADDEPPADDADDESPTDDTDGVDDEPPADDTDGVDDVADVDDDGVGFAVGAAVAALIGLALVARTRR